MLGCPGGEPSSDEAGSFGATAGTTSPATSSASSDGADGTSGTSTTSATSTTDATDGAGPKLDVAVPDVAGETQGQSGCQKVDFLFSIDNSSSMDADQAALIAAFPEFIQAIRDDVAGQDYHIMVVDSDENPVAQYCNDPMSGFCSLGGLCDPFVCGSWDGLGLDACDETLGGGVRGPYGGGASNVDCGLPEDRRYLIEGDPNLEDTFACMAQVGVTGSSQERPMSAMLAALDPDLAQPGACNEGFLREDAVLVVTIVSDDPSTGTPDDAQTGVADPMAWRDQLVALKGGQEDAIVVVGIVPQGSPLSDICVDSMPHHPFRTFVESFGDKGVLGSLCEDFAPTFAEAVGIIDQTCDDFDPAG